MNKDTRKGFFAGLLVALLLLGLVGSALAYTRSLQISDDYTVLVNGKNISLKGASGEELPTVLYDGRIYLPVRAIGEALDMNVTYDGATKTAKLDSKSAPTAAPATPVTPATPTGLIPLAEAKDIALKDAGVAADKAVFTEVKYDTDNDRQVVDVDFKSAGYEYDYEIDAVTGAVIQRDKEID